MSESVMHGSTTVPVPVPVDLKVLTNSEELQTKKPEIKNWEDKGSRVRAFPTEYQNGVSAGRIKGIQSPRG